MSIGRKSPAHDAAYYTYIKELKADIIAERGQILDIIKNAPRELTPGVVTWIRLPQKGRFNSSIAEDKNLSRGPSTALGKGFWAKVKYLKVGQEIAVSDEKSGRSAWDKIIKIELLPEERVYDIEVEGTHNFVGNGIIAHNTYISGNLGIGTTSPYAKLSVAGRGVFDQDIRFDYFTATSTSATSTIASGLAIETSGLVYDWQTNNVGVNTASPSYKLDVNGTMRAVDNVFFNSNTTLGNATTTDVIHINSRISGSLIPTADNILDLGDATNWLRWRTGYFGTSVGIAGQATSTGADLLANGAYTIDSGSTLSINTVNDQPITFGSGNIIAPYASSTALTVSGTASTTNIYVSGSAYLSPMTSGSVFFAGTNGLISQDNANLFFDDSLNRLGVGTTTPRSILQIASARPQLTLTDTGAGTNAKHWFMSSQGGNFYVGTKRRNPPQLKLRRTRARKMSGRMWR